MKGKFKSFISLLLVLIMSLQLSIPSFASELDSSNDSDTEISTMLSDEDFQNEMQELDELAQYYYDYYQENGEYPSEDTANEYYQENIDASSDSIALYMSGSTAASMLSAAGFTITTSNFAELAASLGELAGIGGPVAAAVVVAIIIGVTYAAYSDDISSSGIKKLGSKSSSVADEVGTYVKSNKAEAKSNAREAVISSADYVRNRNKYQYFVCIRIDGYEGDGLGGIYVGKHLTAEEALRRVQRNKKYDSDVFCTSKEAAEALAIAASDKDSKVKLDPPHNTINKPYNCPHYHPIIDGERGRAHIFFEY